MATTASKEIRHVKKVKNGKYLLFHENQKKKTWKKQHPPDERRELILFEFCATEC